MKQKGMPPLYEMVALFISFVFSGVLAGILWYALEHTPYFYQSFFIRYLPFIVWAFLLIVFYLLFARELEKWEKRQ